MISCARSPTNTGWRSCRSIRRRSLALFNQLYDIEWKQQLFQYYNIQSLDIVMMPRAPVDYVAFEKALFFDGTTNTLHHLTRRWQLTNTRYLLGAGRVPGRAQSAN